MKCQHQSCNCDVEASVEYCGDVCEEASGGDAEMSLACACQHGDCYRQEDSALVSQFEVPS